MNQARKPCALRSIGGLGSTPAHVNNRRTMMMVKWKTSGFDSTKIVPIECARETEKAVWVLEYPWTLDGGRGTTPPIERRRPKSSEYDNFHDTWEVAHAFLLACAERELDSARARLAQAQGTHGNVKGLRRPAEAAVGAA